jgi:hypothetical protein
MYSDFAEFNLFVYHSVVNAFLDLVIWCLGPYVDDSREYGFFRCYLAVATRRLCGVWLACRDGIRNADARRI